MRHPPTPTGGRVPLHVHHDHIRKKVLGQGAWLSANIACQVWTTRGQVICHADSLFREMARCRRTARARQLQAPEPANACRLWRPCARAGASAAPEAASCGNLQR